MVAPAVGLTAGEAARRLAEVGPNEIQREAAKSAWVLFLSQFRSPLVWLLLPATVVSGLVGEVADAVAIGTILLLNALVGFLQEHRAEKAMLALRSMTAPRARVIRDGRTVVLSASQVVPGDLLVLEAGDIVAADAKVIEAYALSTNEAPLTGESVPVDKSPAPVPAGAPLAERHDAVFMGTSLATGTGRALVYATGMATELGKIAHLLATAEESETPLQRRLAQVGRTLLFLCLAVVAVVAVLGFARGMSWLEVFMSAVSLAVAAVPEGLPAIVTIALAVGVQRMAARNVLVRRLPAVETLGTVTVVCTDKTGTLTTGTMAVREIWGSNHTAVLEAAAACCDAELEPGALSGTGDPTEVALLVAAAARGIDRPGIEKANPRVDVHPFDSDRRCMSIFRSDGVLYAKGATEAILRRSIAGTEGAAEAAQDLAARGLRVLAVAVGGSRKEERLRLLGLVGIADPPRSEAIDAVAQARRAGIRTVMITGDHPVTAAAIGREMGIVGPGEDPAQVIHARATPEDKLQIVRAWKGRGDVVAMTGDGVNDAPALREAHIGVAMGKTGTEVTREASDMILADDNFASIVSAVREGRGIFDNIRKSLIYLLAGNTGELGVMLGAALVGLPLPLIPLQILWINLITDGLPALALVMDPSDADVLRRPPRRLEEPMLGRPEWTTILLIGALQAAITLGVFVWALANRQLPQARSLAFSTLVFGPLFLAFAFRSRRRLLWEVGAFSNVLLVGVVVLSALLQFMLVSIPATQALFQVGPLSAKDWALALTLGLVPVTLVEVSKLFRHRRRNGNVVMAALVGVLTLGGCGEGRMSADVGPPAAWDDQLRLREAEDLNPDPDTVEIRLEAHPAMLELRAGKLTPVWTYNGGLPGPLIRAKVGDRLIVHFTNNLPEPTTVHWHGLRVPADMDGVPEHSQPGVMPGGSFDYSFTLRDAGLFWYHPHMHSAAQVGFGLYGPLMVEGNAANERRGDLGDELILVLSDMSVDADGTLLPPNSGGDFGTLFGHEGDLLLVNGRVEPTLLAQRGRRQRWRVINAARTRYFQIGFSGHGFVRIGGDGGLREAPLDAPLPVLAPGERADLLVTPDAPAGELVPVYWVPYDHGYGATFMRAPEPLMSVRIAELDRAPRTAPAPAQLRTIEPIDPQGATERTIEFTNQKIDGKLVLGINGQSLNDPLTLHARRGETDRWSITNHTVFDHPFHLHGFFFQVLDPSGRPADVREWKDTVNVPVEKNIQLVVRYEDRPGMWMFHCHILDHADAGMMGMLMLEP